MSVFSSEDHVGMVKRFEIGEYNGNLLPLIYTKVKDWINPVNNKPSVVMVVKADKLGEEFEEGGLEYNDICLIGGKGGTCGI